MGAAQHGNVVRAGLLPSSKLVLLHHKFRFDILLPIGAAQHGHRDKDLVMTTINRRRTVAMEFGM